MYTSNYTCQLVNRLPIVFVCLHMCQEVVIVTMPTVVCDPPCQNGVCVQNDTCSCSEGYTGETCDEAVERECEENLCENGGTCTVVASSTICTCPEEYTGVLCQESSMLFQDLFLHLMW